MRLRRPCPECGFRIHTQRCSRVMVSEHVLSGQLEPDKTADWLNENESLEVSENG